MAKRLGSRLFVSRLSFYTTNRELERWFSPFGLVTEARLVIDQNTRRPKGFGFVTFQSEVEAQNALKAMNGRCESKRARVSEDIASLPCLHVPCSSHSDSLVWSLDASGNISYIARKNDFCGSGRDCTTWRGCEYCETC